MSHISEEQANKISSLVREVEKLSDSEKLLLYLQLPCGRADLPEGCKYKPNNKQGADIFSKKPDQETTQTYTWILSHLEEDPNVSLPKQEVYDEYRAFCHANRFEPLCVADFGKAMKHALPCIKPRRLGQRGNSRYCYSGLKKKYRIESPGLPDLATIDLHHHQEQEHTGAPACAPAAGPGKQSHNQALKGNPSNTDHQYQANTSASSSSSSCASSSASSSAGVPKSDGSNISSGSNNNFVMNLKLEPCTGDECTLEAATSGVCCATTANGDNCGASSSHLQHYVDSMHSSSAHHDHSHTHNHSLPGPQRLTRPLAGYLPNGYHNGPSQTPRHENSHSHSAASYQDFLPRTGTPDDDDYRHNYHDLNRPMVGPAIIPFSQSLTAQLAQQPANGHQSFISHQAQTRASYPPPPPSQQQLMPSNNHPQQLTKLSNGHCPGSQVGSGYGGPEAASSGSQPKPQHAPCQQRNGTAACSGGKQPGSAASGQPAAAYQFQDQAPASSAADSNGASAPASISQNSSSSSTSSNGNANGKYTAPAQVNLSLNSMSDQLNEFEMDFASPFQSPASTPYPVTCNSDSANYLTQDAQNNYYGQTPAVALTATAGANCTTSRYSTDL